MKYNSLLKKSLLIFVVCSLQSCFIGKAIEAPKMRSEFTVENEAMPADFGSDKEAVVLVVQGIGASKWMRKAFKKNYTGPYELVDNGDLNSSKYSDKEKYRYIFSWDAGTGYTVITDSGRSRSGTYKRFYVMDRLEDKKYSSGAEFTFFAKALRVYVENLDVQRAKN